MVEKAFAKVNLHLEVCGLRKDGYHNIQSVMASLNLADVLSLVSLNQRDDATCNVKIIPDGGSQVSLLKDLPEKDNLITKAVLAYFKKQKTGVDVELKLKKEIPSGAGLGGGSSDAAAMLRLLNERFSFYTLEQLNEIAATIGADVPFCLSSSVAFCEGIGDKITKLPNIGNYYVVLVNDATHVNTKLAYQKIDQIKLTKRASHEILVKDELLKGKFPFSSFYNSFEDVVFEEHLALKKYKSSLLSMGAFFALMSGSGSTVYGLFTDFDLADKAKCYFESNGLMVYLSAFNHK